MHNGFSDWNGKDIAMEIMGSPGFSSEAIVVVFLSANNNGVFIYGSRSGENFIPWGKIRRLTLCNSISSSTSEK